MWTGAIFGGGFPEMFLHELENNRSMKDSIRQVWLPACLSMRNAAGLCIFAGKSRDLTAMLMKWQAWCRAYAKCRKSSAGGLCDRESAEEKYHS